MIRNTVYVIKRVTQSSIQLISQIVFRSSGNVLPHTRFLTAFRQAQKSCRSPAPQRQWLFFRLRNVFLLTLLLTLSWRPTMLNAQQVGVEALSPAHKALVVWNLGSDLVALIENYARGISEIEWNTQLMAVRMRAKKVGLELRRPPKLSSDLEQNTSALLGHFFGQVADLYTVISQTHGSRTSAVFITSFYTRLLILYQGIDNPETRRLLIITKEYCQSAGFPDELWVGPLNRVEANFGSVQAKNELINLRNNLFDHLVDLERFEQSGHFAEAASFLWQAALDWWEWAARYAAGETAASIEEYRVAAESVGTKYGLKLLRPMRIRYSKPDPAKDRISALSYLITTRPFVAKEIEEKFGLQTRYLFEFALEAQYLRSKMTASQFNLEVLINLAEQSGVPRSYWKSVVEFSKTTELGDPELTSSVLKMNQGITKYLANFQRRSP